MNLLKMIIPTKILVFYPEKLYENFYSFLSLPYFSFDDTPQLAKEPFALIGHEDNIRTIDWDLREKYVASGA